MTTPAEVLVVGAGPTGLVLALWLSRQGVPVRVIDRTSEPGTTSRALAVQARTLELYRQLNLTDAVIARGHRVPAVNLWVQGERRARLEFEQVGQDLTPYPFLHIFPQDEHERLLIDRLARFGVEVERRTELVGFEERGDRVVATLQAPDGSESPCEARFLAGCDGARSFVRQALGTGFGGGTYREVFYVADVQGRGPAFDGELNVDLDEADFLGVFPLAGESRARLIGTVRGERADHAEDLGFDDVSRRAMTNLKVEVDRVNWFSTYRVHHRVADRFRRGRVFLLGDAAHIHSPAGGQGMNTGIGDAINLAWKLAAVCSGDAPDGLLDSYETERMAFARRLVASTDRMFNLATAEGRVADLIRTRLVPAIFPRAIALEPVREYVFRTVSQITLNYRRMPLSEGAAGEVHGGDRLPWVSIDGADSLEPLSSIAWQAHVFGRAAPELVAWCEAHGLPLNVTPWRAPHGEAGLARDALYLTRPDSYVALADRSGAPAALEAYFAARGIRAAGRSRVREA
jgi:2-polyprenyl-6-methoxyphenol hydroxylase-like FAD-dependent oxidoreductase